MIDGKDYTVVSIDNNHIFTVNITGLDVYKRQG